MKNILIFANMIIILFSNLNCAKTDSDEPASVFNNVARMDATRYGTTITFSNVPDEVTILIIGIFQGSLINVDSNNTITNTDWVGGNRTGLSGFARTGSTNYWKYDSATKDFIEDNSVTPQAGNSWAVWGLNSDMIVICSTEKYTWY